MSLDRVGLLWNGEHDRHIGHRFKVLLDRVLNFMFREINYHGFFFSRSFSRSSSLRVMHLDFDMSLDSLCESFLLSSDAIVAWEIDDLIDEVIDDDDDVDDTGAVDITDETNAEDEDEDKDEDEDEETAKGAAAGTIAIGAEVGAHAVVPAITVFPPMGAIIGSPWVWSCLTRSLPCSFLGLVSGSAPGLLLSLLCGLL